MLTLENEKNYAAQIVRVPKAVKAENSDRLYVMHLFGYGVIGSEEWLEREGELAVLFPAESRLSEAFASFANLYRDTDLNRSPEETGYLEKNGRVRAIKLRGNISSALMLPASVLREFSEWTGGRWDFEGLQEGVAFDTLNKVEISRKFVIPVKENGPTKAERKIKAAFKRVSDKLFPMHVDTDQWFRSEQDVPEDANLVVTQKLHGSSIRIGRPLVTNKLTWLEKLARKFGVRIQETSYDDVAGSRKVIKDPNNPFQVHHYKTDIWTEYLEEVQGAIPDGYVVYGELVGWANHDTPIQAGHTYDCKQGQRKLYVYRVAHVNPEGIIQDLSWEQVRNFCQARGWDHVPELWSGKKRDFNPEDFNEREFYLEWMIDSGEIYRDLPVPLSNPELTGADEGIAIRVEDGSQVPDLYKFKFESHYLFETAQLDKGEADIESQESQ